MKSNLASLLQQSIEILKKTWGIDQTPDIQLQHCKDPKHGDFACNIAMLLAKETGRKPRELAQQILDHLPANAFVTKVEIAGPGFINFYLADNSYHAILKNVLEQRAQFGRATVANTTTILLEYVSANPTGPLHVGHGRGAAYGSSLANLLKAAGHPVHQEYYVNDAGRQMDILAASVWLRYLDLCGEAVIFPSNGYQGDYVWDIAAELHRTRGTVFQQPFSTVLQGVPADATQEGGDKETHIDGIIDNAKQYLGDMLYREVFDLGLTRILCDIRKDLAEFGVEYDEWFSERSLSENGSVEQAIQKLRDSGYLYEKDGAQWFRSTDFGDEKDRVVIRENGQMTYFASDIAYHLNKFQRGFSRAINIWGADHHGYIPRVKASIQAMGGNPEQLEVLLVQFAVLYEGGEKVQMSTRSGEFVTLRELRREVGNDAARFFYVMRRSEQHMDFDMDLAKSQSKDNPVYYVQYAHARICSVFQQIEAKGFSYQQAIGLANLDKLAEPLEKTLIAHIARYPELINTAAAQREPHQLIQYVRDLATDLHSYYDADNKRIRILIDDEPLRNARLCLIDATRQVIQNALLIVGVSAPEKM